MKSWRYPSDKEGNKNEMARLTPNPYRNEESPPYCVPGEQVDNSSKTLGGGEAMHVISFPDHGWGRQTKNKLEATRTQTEGVVKHWEMGCQNREGVIPGGIGEGENKR